MIFWISPGLLLPILLNVYFLPSDNFMEIKSMKNEISSCTQYTNRLNTHACLLYQKSNISSPFSWMLLLILFSPLKVIQRNVLFIQMAHEWLLSYERICFYYHRFVSYSWFKYSFQLCLMNVSFICFMDNTSGDRYLPPTFMS